MRTRVRTEICLAFTSGGCIAGTSVVREFACQLLRHGASLARSVPFEDCRALLVRRPAGARFVEGELRRPVALVLLLSRALSHSCYASCVGCLLSVFASLTLS